uniref:RING-type E3 ubiquitin transferase n=1 Tax=Phallusia mammillata TaxID=59560 RepID=A0A6F9DLC6_9ASCI|nr:zinc finger protein ZF(ZZ/RING)-1 [Phallusia mammillata]
MLQKKMDLKYEDDIPLLGLRVVRGPSWEWKNQDNGEGNVGTVIEVGRSGSRTPDKTVVVQWDCGIRTNYRIGHGGAHDLLVLDSALSGIKHPERRCDACKKFGIRGTRWQCTECPNCDLCTRCYMTNKHNIHHKFKRYDNCRSIGRNLSARHGQSQLQSLGLYKGARVVRGYHWEWGDQDGGKNRSGIITHLCEVSPDDGNTAASVTWDCGRTNRYRVGHKGKVDLRYLSPGRGIPYYKDHLMACHASRTSSFEAQSTSSSPFKVGDPVTVTLSVDILRPMLENHGGWSSDMEELIGKKGHVHRITTNNDVRVQFRPADLGARLSTRSPQKCRWTFHPGALNPVTENSSAATASTSSSPSNTLAEAAMHIGPSSSRDIAATNDIFSHLSPKIVQLSDVSSSPLHEHDDVMDCVEGTSRRKEFDDISAVTKRVSTTHFSDDGTLLHHCLRHKVDDASALGLLDSWDDRFAVLDNNGYNVLHYAAEQGRTIIVEDILRKRSDIADQLSRDGMTPLHLAAFHGHLSVVKALLSCECNPALRTGDFKTAFHLACGNLHFDVITELLSVSGVEENMLNEVVESCVNKTADVCRDTDTFTISDELCQRDASWLKVKSCFLRHIPIALNSAISKSFALVCYLASRGATVSKLVERIASQHHVDCLMDCAGLLTSQTPLAERLCQLCEDYPAVVHFGPCGHVILCVDCARRAKKCVECKKPICSKSVNGEDLPLTSNVEQMQQKLNALQEEKTCPICMETQMEVVFVPCGHTTCRKCSETLKVCHICRKKIEKKQFIYF